MLGHSRLRGEEKEKAQVPKEREGRRLNISWLKKGVQNIITFYHIKAFETA
jgi:hypothetical protein